MVNGDARDGRDDGVGDGCSVEGVRVADRQQQACYPRQRRDMSGVYRLDGDVGMRSWASGRDGVRVRDGLEGVVSGAGGGLEFGGDSGMRGVRLL